MQGVRSTQHDAVIFLPNLCLFSLDFSFFEFALYGLGIASGGPVQTARPILVLFRETQSRLYRPVRLSATLQTFHHDSDSRIYLLRPDQIKAHWLLPQIGRAVLGRNEVDSFPFAAHRTKRRDADRRYKRQSPRAGADSHRETPSSPTRKDIPFRDIVREVAKGRNLPCDFGDADWDGELVKQREEDAAIVLSLTCRDRRIDLEFTVPCEEFEQVAKRLDEQRNQQPQDPG